MGSSVMEDDAVTGARAAGGAASCGCCVIDLAPWEDCPSTTECVVGDAVEFIGTGAGSGAAVEIITK